MVNLYFAVFYAVYVKHFVLVAKKVLHKYNYYY